MKKILVLMLFCGVFVLGCSNQQQNDGVEETAVVEDVFVEDNGGNDQDNNQQEQNNVDNSIDFSQQARDLFSSEKYNEAIDAFTKAIEQDPQEAILYADRGRAKEFANDLDGALADINKSLSMKEEGWIYAERGNVYSAKGEKEQALQDYKQALELDPNLDWVKQAVQELEGK